MSSWFWYSLIAFFLMGIQGFPYKVAAERRCDTALTTFIFMATVAILSSILWAYLREPVGNPTTLTILALVNSLTFLAATMTFIEALKFLSATFAYSIIRLNLVIITVFSFVWFDDQLTLFQVSGIIIALASMLILTKSMNQDGKQRERSKHGIVLLVVSLLASSIAAISSKFAAMYVGKLSFLIIVYSIAALSSMALTKKPNTAELQNNKRATIVIGIAMGVLNFVGYYAFLMALSRGPLSLVASITGMHFVVSVVLSILIYREKLTLARIIGFILTVASIILLRLE